MARRRGLTPEDRRVWEQVAATTIPLRPQPSPAAPPPPEPKPAPSPRPVVPRPLAAPRAAAGPAPDPHAALERAQPQMDRRRFEKLRRGRVEPEARLDLHGLTAERAHAALTSFVLGAHARDARLLLVITGKGRPDAAAIRPHRHGILHHSVPHWLAAPPLGGRVLQVAQAHQRHGGAGAFYVYLRRRRPG
jgi:DNA-nicking Smr family endonuclease